MASQLAVGHKPAEPEVVTLTSVPGFIVFDLPGAPLSAGGTRLAPDISVPEVALLKTECSMVLSTPVLELGSGSRRRHW